jgi:hypothetical protein
MNIHERTVLDDYPPTAEIVGMSSGYAQNTLIFYCHKCKQYEEKTSPHDRAR